MSDARTNTTGIVAALLPKSPKKRAKAVYAAMDAKSREHAARLVEILQREYFPEKRVGKLETEANLRVAPDVAQWVMDDPGGEFLSHYARHLFGRIHGAGIPKDAAQAVVELVEESIHCAVGREHRRRSTADAR